MSIFQPTRLTCDTVSLDIAGLRQGWYADAYFRNIVTILQTLAEQGYGFAGHSQRLAGQGYDPQGADIGNMVVEMQWFTRRKPYSVVAGVDIALLMLEHGTGYYAPDGRFISTYAHYDVEAVQDGVLVRYEGNPQQVQPVLKVRGRYRDVAALETTTVGVLSRATRVATNVYHVMRAARGKPVLFFPARFDDYTVQALDGYAYFIGVQRYNHDYQQHVGCFVSTDAQGSWWGGRGGGTLAHAAISAFLDDTAELMLAFAAILPVETPRIALVDYDNDCVGTTLAVMDAMFARYRTSIDAGQTDEAQRYQLTGVRPDTSNALRDVSVPPLGAKQLDMGVNPRLIFALREAIDSAWQRWELGADWRERARQWCQNVRIVATGGFNAERISQFESMGVPVDIYGVGSSLFSNSDSDGTNNDYTADTVRVQLAGQWYAMAKVGRAACHNPDLEVVSRATQT
ncbi:MAG: nicotinate phosphoribosyltransferase [Chloroflexaceae bacterium]|nr:nicotinate phosphoribosyltransferase [Chloroflexaceae bacterium]